jgi:hypothetical protein
MRVFLTGKRDLEWRWDLADFLTKRDIDFFDPTTYPVEFLSIFKQFKILEGCDLIIACFAGLQTHPLLSILEISYASKLAKEVIIVDDVPEEHAWAGSLPHSKRFLDLDGLKGYLSKTYLTSITHPRFFG